MTDTEWDGAVWRVRRGWWARFQRWVIRRPLTQRPVVWYDEEDMMWDSDLGEWTPWDD